MTDNSLQQKEEVEALDSIYGSIWHKDTYCDNAYSIQINPEVKLFISLNSGYPSSTPPEYQLLAPSLTHSRKELICASFEEIYRDNCGGPILFQWIEKLKEIITDEEIVIENNNEDIVEIIDLKFDEMNVAINCHEIIHGSIIQDRKSTFQGHACCVKSHKEVKEVMEVLLQNKKIAQATHNILAYRIVSNPTTKSILQDFDDDGETHAGGRVLHLLQILNIDDVMVVVTRWYGGINLGPDRFRHINNAARQVLQEGGFIKTSS